MIPLLHDFAGATVLVFGGGTVGARKARRFAAEARVVVVSPSFTDERFEPDLGDRRTRPPDAGVEFVRAAPTPADLPAWFDRSSPALVVAATDDADLNAAVEREARERGVLVNRADVAGGRDPGSVVVPATVREDPVVVSVSTSGASPALSQYVRRRVEEEVAGAGELAELTAELRADLKARGVPPERRREALRAVVAADEVWKGLGTGTTNARQRADDIVSGVLGDTD